MKMNGQRTFELKCGPHLLTLGPRTLIMGILNVTPDSFSDGGLFFDRKAAVAHGEALAATGHTAAIDLLTARRRKEENVRMIQTIDDNLAKLRDKQTQLGRLRKDLDATKREDRRLRERIKKLEDAAKE